MIKLIVFDYNGTLVEDHGIHSKLFEDVLRESRIKVDLKKMKKLLGMGLYGELKTILPEADDKFIEKIARRKINRYCRIARKKKLFKKEVKEALKKIKKKGVKLTILSLSPKKQMTGSMDKKTVKLFDLILGEENLIKLKAYKPNPKGLLYITKKLKIKKNETLYVGDMLKDALTAKNAGIKFVFIKSEWGNEQERKKAERLACERIKKIKELNSLIERV